MLFVYLIIGTALILYTRFFILRSLLTKADRTNMAAAVAKAVWFSPLFIQGLLLLWFAVLNFKAICQGFFLCFEYWILKRTERPDYSFLFLVSYVGIGSLILGLHALLGKLSLIPKTNVLTMLYKVLYAGISCVLLKLAFLNMGLFHPLVADTQQVFFYSNAYVIAAGILIYITLLLQLFFRSAVTEIRYLQLGVLASGLYISISALLAIVLFGVNAVIKAVA